MVKTNKPIDKLEKIRSEMKLKTSALTEQKRKTSDRVVSIMSFKWKKEAEKLWRDARVFLTNKFKTKSILLAKYKRLVAEYKEIGQERKNAAIAALDELGMKTDKRVAAINATRFLGDQIIIGQTAWAYQNMTWGKWVFKEKTNRWYYSLEEAIEEANEQNIVLPQKGDFENTFNALDLQEDDVWRHIVAILLWESKTGYCGNIGDYMLYDGIYGVLGSVSEYATGQALAFQFSKNNGKVIRQNKGYKFVYRPLANKS